MLDLAPEEPQNFSGCMGLESVKSGPDRDIEEPTKNEE